MTTYLIPNRFISRISANTFIPRLDKEIGSILKGKHVLDPRVPLTRYRIGAEGVWVDVEGLGRRKPFPISVRPFKPRLPFSQLRTGNVYPRKDSSGILRRAVSLVLVKSI